MTHAEREKLVARIFHSFLTNEYSLQIGLEFDQFVKTNQYKAIPRAEIKVPDEKELRLIADQYFYREQGENVAFLQGANLVIERIKELNK